MSGNLREHTRTEPTSHAERTDQSTTFDREQARQSGGSWRRRLAIGGGGLGAMLLLRRLRSRRASEPTTNDDATTASGERTGESGGPGKLRAVLTLILAVVAVRTIRRRLSRRRE